MICGNFLFKFLVLEPSDTLSVIPSASLIESRGGLVTCANFCEKYLAIPPS